MNDMKDKIMEILKDRELDVNGINAIIPAYYNEIVDEIVELVIHMLTKDKEDSDEG